MSRKLPKAARLRPLAQNLQATTFSIYRVVTVTLAQRNRAFRASLKPCLLQLHNWTFPVCNFHNVSAWFLIEIILKLPCLCLCKLPWQCAVEQSSEIILKLPCLCLCKLPWQCVVEQSSGSSWLATFSANWFGFLHMHSPSGQKCRNYCHSHLYLLTLSFCCLSFFGMNSETGQYYRLLFLPSD